MKRAACAVLASLAASCAATAPARHPGGAAPGPTPAEAAILEAACLSNVRRLTPPADRSGEAYFSPDGTSLVYQAVRGDHPFYRILSIPAAGGEPAAVSPGVGKTTCAFFRPDGRRVIFASTHLDPEAAAKAARARAEAPDRGRRYAWDFDPAFDVFETSPDGADMKRLTDARGYDAECAYSPDGRSIVFTSTRDGDPEIYAMDADGRNPRRLTRSPGYDGGPFFSPDGRRIVFRSFREGPESAQIRVMGADGQGERRVTNLPGTNWAPWWHPDGRHILFASDMEAPHRFDLYAIRDDGTGLARITWHPGADILPVLSPDGRTLAWTSSREGNPAVWLADFRLPDDLATLRPPPPGTPAISGEEALRTIVFLASPALEGRSAGSDGAEAAARFLAERFRQAGLEPAGDGGTFLQTFEFTARREEEPGNRLALEGIEGPAPGAGADVSAAPFSEGGEVSGAILFAGLGIAQREPPRDDYAGAEIRGRVILALAANPSDADPHADALLRSRADAAKERGAAGILFVPPPGGAGPLPMERIAAGGRPVLPAGSVTRALADRILRKAGTSLAEVEPAALGGRGRPVEIPGARATLTLGVRPVKAIGRNVLGWLPPAGPDALAAEHVVAGAHYDHLGLGEEGSLAERPGEVHPGADDNASGVAALVEMTEAAAAAPRRRRGILFAAFDGEERGLLGSSHYVEHPSRPLAECAAMLNLDMVGRLREGRLDVLGTGTAAEWPALLSRLPGPDGLRIQALASGWHPSDSTSFHAKGLPVLFLFTGGHPDYHRPGDAPDKIRAAGLERVSRFGAGLLLAVADLEKRPIPRTDEPPPSGTSPGRFRVRLGTIPDYAFEGEGVRIQGVAPGSPAERAGLRAGDVVRSLAGRAVRDVTEYTACFHEIEPGRAVPVTVLRAGREVTLTVVPAPAAPR